MQTQSVAGNNRLHLAAWTWTSICLTHHILEKVNDINNDGETPLFVAVKELSLKMGKIFIKAPTINITHQLINGTTAQHIAIQENAISFLAPICQSNEKPSIINHNEDSCLHAAAFKTNPVIIRTLLDFSKKSVEKINCLNEEGETPLIKAIKADNTLVVKILLQYSADTTIPNEDGNLSLHLTIKIRKRTNRKNSATKNKQKQKC